MTCMRYGFLGLVIGSSVALTASVRAEAPQGGKRLYDQHCAACHGAKGKGDGPTGKVLIPAAADLTALATRKRPPDQLRKIIEDGKPGTAMMAWKGRLTDAEVHGVLAYVQELSK